MNYNEKKLFSPKNIGIVIFIIVVSPLVISLLSIWAKPLTFIAFDSSVWITFWGSYLGGIIGTIGVIYVAHLQNKLQSELNAEMIKEQSSNHKEQIKSQLDILQKTEKYTRERILLQNDLNLINEYKDELKEFNELLNETYDAIDQYIYNKNRTNSTDISIRNSPNIKPYYEKAVENLDIYSKKLTDIYPFKLADLMYSLKYNQLSIKYLEYKTSDIVKINLLDSIVATSERIKLDNKDLHTDFSEDKRICQKSYQEISKWVRAELANNHSNLMYVSVKLKNLK